MQRAGIIGFLLFLAIPYFAGADAGFTRDLYFGMRGNADVARLQEFLRGQGYFTYPQSTGNYFTVTLQAVKAFQKANGLSPVGGYFGPQSRAVANKILLAGSQQTGSATPPVLSSGSATISPYKGQIAIGYVAGWGTVPEYESMTVENKTGDRTVLFTGFRIENSRGEVFVIPPGQEIPGFNPAQNAPIFLKPGDRATITAGKQERRMNFRENICTGYFDETSNFIPGLSHSCPRPDIKTLGNLSDSCLAIISSASSCRTVSPAFPTRVPDGECNSYLGTHLSYVGCVDDYRSRPDFYSHTWLIWMQRDKEFFRNSVEHIMLRDQQGKIVDEYSY